MSLDSVLRHAKRLVEGAVSSGDAVIDATVGKGNDTLLLAQLVGAEGLVFGFDIQIEAIEAAKLKLGDHSSNINWIHASHEFMLENIPEHSHGQVSGIMFNLGYLPGFDHQIVTSASSTVAGLNAAVQLLKIGGILTIVAYTGHPGAQDEAGAVEQWASLLPQKLFNVLSYRFINQQNNPPFLLAVEKKGLSKSE